MKIYSITITLSNGMKRIVEQEAASGIQALAIVAREKCNKWHPALLDVCSISITESQ
jgi:hypothetical protein